MTLPIGRNLSGPRRVAAGLFFIFAVAVSGCATQQARELALHPPASLASRVELRAVPFYAQQDYQCGPAALAMALNFGGAQVTPEQLVPQVYLPGRQGSLQAEMLAGARRHGFVAVTLAPQLADLLVEITAGHPVVVLQNLGLDWIPVWHYAIAVGYDLERGYLVLRSGLASREEVSLNTFDRTWARGGRWAMLALAPGDLPVTIDAEAYVSAAARLEKTEPASAKIAYEAVLRKQPDHYMALMGSGNVAYAGRDLAGAAAAFRAASRVRPDSAAAFNNLSQALFDSGQYAEALRMARVAVSLGGPLLATTSQTRDEIEAVIAQGSAPRKSVRASAAPRRSTRGAAGTLQK